MPCTHSETKNSITSSRSKESIELEEVTALICAIMDKTPSEIKEYLFRNVTGLKVWHKRHTEIDKRRLSKDLSKYCPSELEILRQLLNE